jgi:hypothetical protein
LIACIGCDGSVLKLMVIVPRKTVNGGLLLTSVTFEKVGIISQPKVHVNTALAQP